MPIVDFDIEHISKGREIVDLKQLFKFVGKGKILYLLT